MQKPRTAGKACFGLGVAGLGPPVVSAISEFQDATITVNVAGAYALPRRPQR